MPQVLAFLFTWLAANAGNIVKRILVALGIGTITYSGVDAAFAAAKTAILANFSSFAGGPAQIVALAGLPEALGIILGAVAARISLMVLSHIGKVL